MDATLPTGTLLADVLSLDVQGPNSYYYNELDLDENNQPQV